MQTFYLYQVSIFEVYIYIVCNGKEIARQKKKTLRKKKKFAAISSFFSKNNHLPQNIIPYKYCM